MPDSFKQPGFENKFADSKEYQKFLMGLKSTRAILTSDNFVYETNVYISRYFGYQRILSMVKANNKKLIALLQNQLQH
jgi:hypothetical protein